jgi:organic radical activating enzyme
MKPTPTIEWQVCGVCNYDCSYCIQSKIYRQGHPTEAQIEQFLSFFERLPQKFEIKMTGGEPFAFRGFVERIIPGLLQRTNHTISLLTNLSAPLPILLRFAENTKGRLGVVSASLHLEHTTPQDFVKKALLLKDKMDKNAHLTVSSVLVPGRILQVLAAKEVLEQAGLRLFPQLMKIDGGIASYSEEEQALVSSLIGADPTPDRANVAPSYLGKNCLAGVLYFVLLQNGDGYSCRTARRFKQGYLGNVFSETLQLWDKARACPYTICPCTTPANRGMISGIGKNRESE